MALEQWRIDVLQDGRWSEKGLRMRKPTKDEVRTVVAMANGIRSKDSPSYRKARVVRVTYNVEEVLDV